MSGIEKMGIKSAVYEKSVHRIKDFPGAFLPEIAVIGRSNVGKSSLINMLTGRKKLARTSSTPGKTQTINFFLINRSWRLVDLPGYGWAKVSKRKKLAWSALVRDYLLNRKNLVCLIALLDIRLEPQHIDMQFMSWAVEKQIPIVIVFTKADKLSRNKVIQHIEKFKKVLLEDWAYLPKLFVSSAVDKRNKEEILDYIESIL